MMKISALKNEYISLLKVKITDNVDNYLEGKNFTHELFKNESDFAFLNVPFPEDATDKPIFLDSNKSDLENAISLYEGLRYLSPYQASDEKIWVYLSHFVFFEYLNKRWKTSPPKEKDDGTLDYTNTVNFVLNKYFLDGVSSPLANHALSRLWWTVHLTYDENLDNPYELTEIMLSNFDITWGILARKLNNNKVITKGILLAFKEMLNNGEKLTSERIKLINKYLNREAGIKVLDVLTPFEIKEIVLSF